MPYSHSCALLTAICRQEGINADYEPLWPGWFEKMLDYDIAGFSFITNAEYELSKPYMKAAKKLGKTVLVGGVYARMGAYIDPALVDIVCRGEAEPITDYIKHSDLSIFQVPHYQASIDGLPMPDLSHVAGYEFHRGYKFLQGKKIIPYQSSRGCGYGKCSFCMVKFQPKKIRMKHTIAEDLTYLSDLYHPDLFYLAEELPPYFNKEWRDQWEDIYFPFHCYIRADIKPDHLEWMIGHGLKVAAFGIETGSEKLRNNGLNKGLTDDQIMTTVDILRKNGLNYAPFYMANLPGENAQDREDTQRMIREVGGYPAVWEYQNLSKFTGVADDNSASHSGGHS